MNDEADTLFLCMSIRGSERAASPEGRKLDKLQYQEHSFPLLLQEIFGNRSVTESSLSVREDLILEQASAIFVHQFGSLFSVAKVLQLAQTIVDVNVDAVRGTYRVLSCIGLQSNDQCLESVEGDDLILVWMLQKCSLPPTFCLNERPVKPSEATLLLRSLGIAITGNFEGLSDHFRLGFYLVSGQAVAIKLFDSEEEEKNLAENSGTWTALCSGTAYFFYCWLICQRIERNLLCVSANGEWESEFRKMLLVKKQLVAVRKTALLKNRAFPGSLLLKQLKECLDTFRLEEQLSYLTDQAEQTSKALDAQNAYITSSSIRSIETIVFVSAVLGLAVALNAIQMPPFFDQQAQNALLRPVFWFVFLVVIFGALLLMGIVRNSNQIKKIFKWMNRK